MRLKCPVGPFICSLFMAFGCAGLLAAPPQRLIFDVQPVAPTIAIGEPLGLKVRFSRPMSDRATVVYVLDQPQRGDAPLGELSVSFHGGSPDPLSFQSVALFTEMKAPAAAKHVLVVPKAGTERRRIGGFARGETVRSTICYAPVGLPLSFATPGQYELSWSVSIALCDKELPAGADTPPDAISHFSGHIAFEVMDESTQRMGLVGTVVPTELKVTTAKGQVTEEVADIPLKSRAALSLWNSGTGALYTGMLPIDAMPVTVYVVRWEPSESSVAEKFIPVRNTGLSRMSPLEAPFYQIWRNLSYMTLKPGGACMPLEFDVDKVLQFSTSGKYTVVFVTAPLDLTTNRDDPQAAHRVRVVAIPMTISTLSPAPLEQIEQKQQP